MAEQKCKRIERRDLDSLRSDPNVENWKETSRNKRWTEIDGKHGRDGWRNKSERQRRETERMEIVIEHTEMVGNRRECHGKAGERWRRSEKIWYMTVLFPIFFLRWIDAYMPHRNIRLFSLSLQFYFILFWQCRGLSKKKTFCRGRCRTRCRTRDSGRWILQS